jgi:hypothetical protein
MSAILYKIGSDIIHVVSLVDCDNEAILLENLTAYGIEIYRGNNLVGKWGYNLADDDFVDDYYEATGDSEITFKIPASEFTKEGFHSARLYVKNEDTDFDSGSRGVYSDSVVIFNLVQ